MSNDFHAVTVPQVVTRYMTRYSVLSNLIHYAYRGSQCNSLNIFIDLYCIYRTLYSREYRTQVNDYRDYTVCILDLCAHYRSFFKYLGVDTTFFLISAHNIPKHNLSIIPNYNKVFSDKLMNTGVNNMISINTDLLDLLCPYLPNIHFLKTEFESSSLMNEIIKRENIKNPKIENLIISSDEYPMQLCSLYDNVTYLYPVKFMGEDRSRIICNKTHSDHQKTFWSIILQKMNRTSPLELLDEISTSNLMLLMSLNRFTARNLTPAILNITTTVKSIVNFIGYSDLRLTPETIFSNGSWNISDDQKLVVSNRFKCLDLLYQDLYFQESLEPKTLHYENLEDPDTIQLINDQYFADNPIDILRL